MSCAEPSRRGVEVRPFQALDQLLRRQRHLTRAVQYHPQPQDLLLHTVLAEEQAVCMLQTAEAQPVAEHQSK